MSATMQEALNQGAQLLRARKLGEAKALAEALVEQFPDQARVRLFAAETASLMGDIPAAVAFLDAVPASSPELAVVLSRKARFLFANGRRADALGAARVAVGMAEGQPALKRELAGVLRDCGQVEEAQACLEQGLTLAPDDPAMLYDLAMTEYHLNRAEAAEIHLAHLLEVAPFHGPGLHLRSALRTQCESRNHVDDLRQRLGDGPAHPRFVAATHYALAKELEDLGQYEESIAALDAGARAYRSTLAYDSDAEMSAHESIRSALTKDTLAALGPGYADEQPVFVIGMPRSGTTLVERMLSAHSQLVSIGEFTEFPRRYGMSLHEQHARDTSRSPTQASLDIDFAALGKAYCLAARELAGAAPAFVDKLPYNFLYCGYILAALPNAKLIHLTRHPLDTCYAVYKTLFFGAYSFSYDLDELASYYISYYRLMAHWRAVLDGRILDVAYEDLVREPDAQVRRIVDWCGLAWEPSVLDFHERKEASMTASAMQVRRPVYTDSIGSWHRAEGRFASIKARFESAGIPPSQLT